MSSVYLARHVLIDRVVAIKTLRRDLARDPKQRDRFLREARAANRIHHKHIVEITDFGETEDGLVFLVMEYVPGRSLLDVMRHEVPFAPARALAIADQIASGLARAHQMGVIHRDLKPENVQLVDGDEGADFVKVLDFGIAKIVDAPTLTGSQQLFGTPGYIAPEYIQSNDIDGRADLYSLGVLLYEMVTGALPFDYQFPGDLLAKHVSEPPVPPRTRRPELPQSLDALILQALEKRPERRFRDAYHFRDDLRRVAESLSEGDTPPVFEGRDTWIDAEAPFERTPFEPKDEGADVERGDAGSPWSDPAARNDERGSDEPERPATEHHGPRRAPERDGGSSAGDPGARGPDELGLLGVRRWRARFDAIVEALAELEPPLSERVMADRAEAASVLTELEREAADCEADQARIESLASEARRVRDEHGARVDRVAEQLSAVRGRAQAFARGEEPSAASERQRWIAERDRLERELEARRAELERESEATETEMIRLGRRAEAALRRLEALSERLRAPLDRLEATVRSR
jgi:serine/threonine-protein kinase